MRLVKWPKIAAKILEILGTKLAGPPISGGNIPTVIKMFIV